MTEVRGSTAARESTPRSAMFVTLLCWSIVVFDGYDLTVYGAVLPKLQDGGVDGWQLTPQAAGGVGSMAFLGMLIGALLAGRISDTIGRRKAILWCTLIFSIFTIACALAPSWEWFAIFRLISGIGLGGVVPTASAMVTEVVKAKHQAAVSTLMMSGIPIGGVVAALLGLFLMDPSPAVNDWHIMFYVAIVGLLVVLPAAFFMLPESQQFKAAQANAEIAKQAKTLAGSTAEVYAGPKFNPGWRGLFDRQYVLATFLFAIATVATLFTWYGLGTWLPKLMSTAGAMTAGLGFSVALNLGAVAGSIVTALVSVKVGPLKTAMVAAAIAAIGLFFLLADPSQIWNYVIFIFAGIGTHGTQCLIIGAVAGYYPTRLRGSALGWALGVGRIGAVVAPQAGGLLLAAAGDNVAAGVRWNFIMFASAAAAAAVILFVTSFLRPVDEDALRKQAAENPAPDASAPAPKQTPELGPEPA